MSVIKLISTGGTGTITYVTQSGVIKMIWGLSVLLSDINVRLGVDGVGGGYFLTNRLITITSLVKLEPPAVNDPLT